MGVLTNEERQNIKAEARALLEKHHAERLDVLEKKNQRRKRRKRRSRPTPDHREGEVAALKRAVREAFYKEHDYVLYQDSTGREHWLCPEEYEYRMRRKQRKRKRNIASMEKWKEPRIRAVIIYLFLGLVAVATGLLLVSR